MPAELGKGYIQLLPSARGFQAAAERELRPDLEKAGDKLGDDTAGRFNKGFSGGLKTGAKVAATGFVAAFAGAAIIGKQSVDAASNLEESQNKVNVVFKDGSGVVNAWAKNSAKALGQSEQQALDAAGGFGNLFVQLGIGSKEAAGMSTGMVNLASDFASFHNADISEVLTAQSAAFRGEFDAVQKFVPTINAAAVEQKAMEMGLAATTDELDAQDKALATQALLVEGAGDAAGDFARTSDGLANQQRILSAEFENAKASIGKALIPAMSAVVSFILDKVVPAFQAVVAWVKEHWPAIEATIGSVVQGIMDVWAKYGQPAVDAIVAAFQFVVDWFTDNWPEISERLGGVWEQVQEIFQTAADVIEGIIKAVVATVSFIWDHFGQDIIAYTKVAWDFIRGIVESAIEIVHGIIKTVMSLIRGDWGDAWDGIKMILSGFWDQIKTIVRAAVDTVKVLLSAAWTAIKLVFESAWNGIVNFFRDRVYQPIVDRATALRDTVIGIVQGLVDGVKSVWNGMLDVFTWFRDHVVSPIESTVGRLKTAIVDAFGTAVDGVKGAWDRLQDIVKVPINAVIGFYNVGIRGVWNNVISKIPGIGDLPSVAKLASGGRVPGSGNRDTVPAMLTPGEFVITKKSASAWGTDVLEMLNRGPGGTVDPAVFGYASGGAVRSMEEAQKWARDQAGKPYKFPMVGPNEYDCSGFTSALLNYILGLPVNRRRHSSGSVRSDPALAPGIGDYPNGLVIGARPPYQLTSAGNFVGHTAASIGALNAEATPPRVRVGGASRGGTDGMFPVKMHLPGFGGLSDEDKGIVGLVKSLVNMALPDLGGGPMADLMTKLFSDLPGRIYDFLVKKLPGAIVDGIKDAAGGLFKAITPFADGGTNWAAGPMLVGERGPEVRWGSRGEYIQANDDLAYGGGAPHVTLNHYGETVTPGVIARGIRAARLAA